MTGHRRDSIKGIGWEFLFVAVDDPASIAFTGMHPTNARKARCSSCMTQWPTYTSMGVCIKHVLIDNGSAFRSKAFRVACTQHGIIQKLTRTYRPQTNGKAERFIQSALREWVYD